MVMGEFNSDDHYIYDCGQGSCRRNGVAVIVNKRVQNAVLGCNLKNDRMISLFPGQTMQHHSNPSLWPNHWCQRSLTWSVLWRYTRLSRTNTKQSCLIHHKGLECKCRKSRDTWNKRQVWPWSTKWSRAKANRILSRECTGCSKHPFPQYKRWL